MIFHRVLLSFCILFFGTTAFADRGEIVLLQDFEIPPGDGLLYIQSGRVTTLAELREFDLYCQLELRAPNAMSVTVPAGRFSIDQVKRTTDPQGIVALPWMLADGGDGGGPGFYQKGKEFYFQHSSQASVWRLACVELIEAWDWREPTLDEMRAELKGLILLR